MKKIYLILLVFNILSLSAQQLSNTDFTLDGKYVKLVKNTVTISGYPATNYNFYSSDLKVHYQIAVMKYNSAPNYLDEIKKQSEYKYSKINFKGSSAITSERELFLEGHNNYTKDVMFFKNGYFYSIFILTKNKKSLKPTLLKLSKNLTIKH